MRPRGLRRRFAMLVASASLVGSLSVVAAPAAFAAIPAPPATGCTWGAITWTFGANTKPWVITDYIWTSQAPGGSLTVGQTMNNASTVTTSISGTVATSAEAGVFFAKASASASLTLAGSGSSTTSFTQTTQISVTNNTSTQKRYVIWRGVRKVTMMAYRYQCSRSEAWVYVASAPLTSFASHTHSSIRCDLSYSAGTVEAAAKAYC